MVKSLKLKSGLGFLTLMFGVSGWANAACLIEDTVTTTGVQSDSGQGNYDCSVLNTANGAQMTDLIALGVAREFPVTIDIDGVQQPATRWEVDKNIYNQPLYQVHLVSTFNKGQGKRCNYLYGNLATYDSGLGAADSGAVETVTICGDPTPLELGAPQSDIITTVGDGCDASFVYDDRVTDPEDPPTTTLVPDISLGFSASATTTDETGTTVALPETIAVCSSVENDLEDGQIECAPNEGANANPDYDPALCLTPDYPDGSYDLETCAPVLWDRGDLKYCWYYENKVCDVAGGIFCEEGRRIGTFIPKTDIATFDASFGVHNGSTTYTVCFRGRCYYQ